MKPQTEEAWLSGAVPGIDPILMPAAHALIQAARDIEKAVSGLSNDELWIKAGGTSSVGFHLLHICGSIDRLLTYAKANQLTAEQFEELHVENDENSSLTTETLLHKTIERIESAIDFIRQSDIDSLFEKRVVGRKELPTNVFGLLFHIAEHTQRHVGQLITIANIVRKS